MTGDAPHLFTCSPTTRLFPPEWKDVCFRRLATRASEGEVPTYTCPLCHQRFSHEDIGFLEGDHVWPYALFGDTSWENYQLLCGDCNARKRASVSECVREYLGAGEFRQMIIGYLREHVPAERVSADVYLLEFLKR